MLYRCVSSFKQVSKVMSSSVETAVPHPSALLELEYFESVVRTAMFADESGARGEVEGKQTACNQVAADIARVSTGRTVEEFVHLEELIRVALWNEERKERSSVAAAWRVVTDDGDATSDEDDVVVAAHVAEEIQQHEEVSLPHVNDAHTAVERTTRSRSIQHDFYVPEPQPVTSPVEWAAIPHHDDVPDAPVATASGGGDDESGATDAPHQDVVAEYVQASRGRKQSVQHDFYIPQAVPSDSVPSPAAESSEQTSEWATIPHHEEATEAPGSTSTTAAAIAAPLPADDIQVAMQQMITQMEVMVRCMVARDEDDAHQALMRAIYEIAALRTFHEGAALLREDETQRRYVVAAEEGYDWYSLGQDCETVAVDVEKAVAAKAVFVNQMIADIILSENVNASRSGAAEPAATVEATVNAADIISPLPSNDQPHELIAEVVDVLLRFVNDLRAEITEEELEMRDVLSIEMELDRDEIVSIARHPQNSPRQPPPPLDHDDNDGAQDEGGVEGTRFNIHPDVRLYDVVAFQVETAEQYERQALTKLRDHMQRHTSMALERMNAARPALHLDKYSSAEEVADAMRAFGSVTITVLFQWEETLDALWATATRTEAAQVHMNPFYRAPGLIVLPSNIGEHSVCDSRSFVRQDTTVSHEEERYGNESVARVGRSEDNRTLLVNDEDEDYDDDGAVPGAANLGRVGSAPDRHAFGDSDGQHKKEQELSDDEVEAAYRVVQQQLQVRDNGQRIQDLHDDEDIERELVELAADEERRGIVYFFASCVSEEYDWNLGGYILRMRRVPVMEPPQFSGPGLRRSSSTSTSPTEVALRALIKPKDRHLPMHLRTPIPPPRAATRCATNAAPMEFQPIAPSGGSPRFSRQGHYTHTTTVSPYPPLSRSQLGGGGARSVSRITDLMHVTSRVPSQMERIAYTPHQPPRRPLTPFRGTLGDSVNAQQAALTV